MVISVYYWYAFYKLENERLNEIFGSVLPQNRFVLQIITQFVAGGENGGDMSSVTSEWICSYLRGGSRVVNEKKIIRSDLFPTDR